MSDFLNQLKHFSKHLGKGVTELFKKESKRPIKLDQLATLIISNQNGSKKTTTLLGLVFNTYKVKVGPIKIKLETKGKKDDYILEISAYENGEQLFSYKSYEKETSLKEKHLLPEYVHAHIDQLSKA